MNQPAGNLNPSPRGNQILRWFGDSPDAGDPACVCSYCAERIEASPEGDEDWAHEINADEGEPIRMWSSSTNLELRLHAKCLNACLELGLLSLGGKS